MSIRQREEIYWREQRRRLVEAWNRSNDRLFDIDDDGDIDLASRVRILHQHEDDARSRPVPR